jgi:predicted nucleic acid-binding Zn ribbon protein
MPIYEYRCTSCGHTLEVIQIQRQAFEEVHGMLRRPRKADLPVGVPAQGGGWYNEGYGGHGKSSSPSSSSSSSPSSSASPSSAPAKPGKANGSKPEGGKAAAGGCGSGGCGCH